MVWTTLYSSWFCLFLNLWVRTFLHEVRVVLLSCVSIHVHNILFFCSLEARLLEIVFFHLFNVHSSSIVGYNVQEISFILEETI